MRNKLFQTVFALLVAPALSFVPVYAATPGTIDGIAVGHASCNISSMNGATMGTSAGNAGSIKGLSAPGSSTCTAVTSINTGVNDNALPTFGNNGGAVYYAFPTSPGSPGSPVTGVEKFKTAFVTWGSGCSSASLSAYACPDNSGQPPTSMSGCTLAANTQAPGVLYAVAQMCWTWSSPVNAAWIVIYANPDCGPDYMKTAILSGGRAFTAYLSTATISWTGNNVSITGEDVVAKGSGCTCP